MFSENGDTTFTSIYCVYATKMSEQQVPSGGHARTDVKI